MLLSTTLLYHSRFSPEQLWILNPKRILKKLDLDQGKHVKEIELQEKNTSQETAFLSDASSINSKDCWICYDSDRQDAGPLIQPCHCRGDVSAVHHDCLRRWLVEVKELGMFLSINRFQRNMNISIMISSLEFCKC